MKKKYAIILFALLFCFYVYVFYRTGKTVVTSIVIDLLGRARYDDWRAALQLKIPLPDLVVYSIPEGLWVFCITITSIDLYLFQSRYKLVYLPLIFAIGLEFSQLLGLTKGTFDLIDITVSLIAWAVAVFLMKNEKKRRDLLKPFDRRSLICVASYLIVYLAHVLN